MPRKKIVDSSKIIADAYMTAVNSGDIAWLRHTSRGTDPKLRNEALIRAAKMNDVELMKFLIKDGADIHYRNDQPLFSAVCNDATDAAITLIEKGVDIQSKNGLIASTAFCGKNLKLAKYLLDDTDIDRKVALKSALLYSTKDGYSEIVDLFSTEEIFDIAVLIVQDPAISDDLKEPIRALVDSIRMANNTEAIEDEDPVTIVTRIAKP